MARFFFMHVGSFVSLLVYGVARARGGPGPDGVRAALHAALVVEAVYVVLAARRGELKHADYWLCAVFALGTALVHAGVAPVVTAFQLYSPTIFFGAFTLMALVPLVLGRETFTYYYARRQTPRWQQRLPTYHHLNRVLAGFWTLVFLAAATLAATAPLDWHYTALYPNLLVFAVGVPAPFWITPLYLRLFPPPLPTEAEPLIMGMPFAFDAKAAQGVDATIQFHVSGDEPGAYWVRVASGRCESFAGTAPAPSVTVHTPGDVWVRIVHGELDRAQAIENGLYRVEGDLATFVSIQAWFPPRPARS
jgi:hypothetical protein